MCNMLHIISLHLHSECTLFLFAHSIIYIIIIYNWIWIDYEYLKALSMSCVRFSGLFKVITVFKLSVSVCQSLFSHIQEYSLRSSSAWNNCSSNSSLLILKYWWNYWSTYFIHECILCSLSRILFKINFDNVFSIT